MSDGFGRRPAVTRESLRAIQAAPVEKAGGGFCLPGAAKAIVLGVGAIGLLIGVYVAAMKGFGRALDRHWSTNVGYPGVEDAYKRAGSTDKLLESAHNDCKSRSDFVGRHSPKKAVDVMSADAMIIGQTVVYLSCLAREKPERFCQSAHRTHLFGAVHHYYWLKGKMREEHVLMNGAPFAANRVFAGSAGGEQPPASAMTQESDPRVIDALKALVAGGYVSPRDLVGATGGWPNDLELVLRGVEPRQKGCA